MGGVKNIVGLKIEVLSGKELRLSIDGYTVDLSFVTRKGKDFLKLYTLKNWKRRRPKGGLVAEIELLKEIKCP